jgi:hypothetical protein
MARCAVDPRVAGFAGDRGSPSNMLSPVSLLSRIMGRNATVFGTYTLPAYGIGQFRADFGGLTRYFRHALGQYHLLPHVMIRSSSLPSGFLAFPHYFATLSGDGSGMGRIEATYQHSQTWRRLCRSSQSIRRTDSRGRGSAPLLGEVRFLALGEVAGHVIHVVYTWRGRRRRIISARRASRR